MNDAPMWSPQQSSALDAVATWLADPFADPIFRLFGYAGTGKTTLAMHLAEGVPGGALFAAYTGKAASVLRAKGCPGASTIHSLIYIPRGIDHELMAHLKSEIKRLRALESRTEAQDRELQNYEEQFAEIRAKAKNGPAFDLNDESPIRECGVVVVDECSMVNEEMGEDLLSFGKKVLVLGDPAQLPPVKGGGFFTEARPDRLLTEIHRQALDNPIIRYATLAREQKPLPFGNDGAARKIRKQELTTTDMIALGGQILTGMNKTRRKINAAARRALGRDADPYPVEGDKLVCLRNDKTHSVLNGVLCDAKSNAVMVEGETDTVDMIVAYEDREIEAPVDTAAFDAYRDASREDDINLFRPGILALDYGYALTVHKSQGSQWSHVTIADDGFGLWGRGSDLRHRWLYTAITRAAESLTIIA